VSLNIQREKETIRIRYQDDNRSGEVVIDLNENNVIIYQANNLRIIFEVSKSALLEIEEKIKEHAKVDIGKLRHALKTEIIQLLTTKNALNPSKSLSLDDILEITQYEKEAYPTINKLIQESGGISSAKRLLALVIASLRREGKIAKTEIENMHGKLAKYYLLRR